MTFPLPADQTPDCPPCYYHTEGTIGTCVKCGAVRDYDTPALRKALKQPTSKRTSTDTPTPRKKQPRRMTW